MIGDDEHAWSDSGIANLEWGCYPKLIDLSPKAEPEIFHAVFHEDEPNHHGAIVENLMVYPDGSYDLSDSRLTPTRAPPSPSRTSLTQRGALAPAIRARFSFSRRMRGECCRRSRSSPPSRRCSGS